MAIWGTAISGVKQQVAQEFEPQVGQVIEYQSSGFAAFWQSEQNIVDDIVNNIRNEGHEPIFVSVQATGNYLVGYTYNTTVQLRVKHSSPIAISIIILAVIVLLTLVVLYFTAQSFYRFVQEAPLFAGGLILLAILGVAAVIGFRLPKRGD